jgi:hypothetical protein
MDISRLLRMGSLGRTGNGTQGDQRSAQNNHSFHADHGVILQGI